MSENQALDPRDEVEHTEDRSLAAVSTVGGGPLAAMSDDEFQAAVRGVQLAIERMETIQRSVMREGADYGEIPGTGKKVLYKPGAELLNKVMSLDVSLSSTRRVEVVMGSAVPMITYTGHCVITDPRSGRHWSASGTANSWESKYRYRQGKRTCPNCGQEVRSSKTGDGYYCWVKTGGCGATWPNGAREIESQTVGRIENPDVADQDNTLCKMAEKRALVAATLLAHNASRLFTQDIEIARPGTKKEKERPPMDDTPRGREDADRDERQARMHDDSEVAALIRLYQDSMNEEPRPPWIDEMIKIGKMRDQGFTWRDAVGDADDAVKIRKWMHGCLSAQAKELEDRNLNSADMTLYKPWHIKCRIVLKAHHWYEARKHDTNVEEDLFNEGAYDD